MSSDVAHGSGGAREDAKRWRGLLRTIIPVAVVVGVLAGFLYSALAAARERARRTKCIANLKCLVYACQLYAGDNEILFPPDLDALFEDYVTDGELFLCPSVSKATEMFMSDFRRPGPSGAPRSIHAEHTDYVYVSGLTAADPPDYVMAFDDEWNHGGDGMSVVHIDFQRYWTSDIDWVHEQLAKQKREVAARGREMKLIRPAWSSWPDPTASSDPRAGPGMGQAGSSLLAGAVVAAIVALLLGGLAAARRPSAAADEDAGGAGPRTEDNG